MIARILAELSRAQEFETVHLSFEFTRNFKTIRRGNLSKVWELLKVIGRILRIRLAGPIDVLIYPAGGPQTVPIIRDILLLPWVLLAAQRVVLHFHAAGIADRLGGKRGVLGTLLHLLYRRSYGALVMTDFNRRDPLCFGIRRITILPHRLPDEFDPLLLKRNPAEPRILAVGHLCPDKGTPALLRAFARLAPRHPTARLELVGECLPPMTDASLQADLRELGIQDRVLLTGVLTGRAKQEAFGRATHFAFPTVAPYESFGLVMVEAMMWSLPILATDWRGNRDVLGETFEGVCFEVGDDLAASLESALERSLTKAISEPSWGRKNREIYEARYRSEEQAPHYARIVHALLERSESI
jgi:glycosyltransferase involved in cell wall biosynthesis